jgi:hypothetical protein
MDCSCHLLGRRHHRPLLGCLRSSLGPHCCILAPTPRCYNSAALTMAVVAGMPAAADWLRMSRLARRSRRMRCWQALHHWRPHWLGCCLNRGLLHSTAACHTCYTALSLRCSS